MSNLQKMIYIMDVNGWEQDGSGLDFVDVISDDKLHFENDEALYEYIVKHFLKK